jgi:putative ATP-binding cassette transporter
LKKITANVLINSTSARPFYAYKEWATDPEPEFKALIYTKLLPAPKAKGKTVLILSMWTVILI